MARGEAAIITSTWPAVNDNGPDSVPPPAGNLPSSVHDERAAPKINSTALRVIRRLPSRREPRIMWLRTVTDNYVAATSCACAGLASA
jgi:hypothetical protein